MADPLSMTASVIAVVEISNSVISHCYQYVTKAYNAQNDVLRLINVVSSLKDILDDLDTQMKTKGDKPESHLHRLDPPLKTCKQLLERIYSKLSVVPEKVNFKGKLKWPFKEKEIKDILERIEKQK